MKQTLEYIKYNPKTREVIYKSYTSMRGLKWY